MTGTDEGNQARPKCPDCKSGSWLTIDEGPLECLDCGTEWIVDGFHHPEWLTNRGTR